MKSLLFISKIKQLIVGLILATVFFSTNALSQQKEAGFQLYSFNSKIPLSLVPNTRIGDVTNLGSDGIWTNIRLKGGIPAWLSSEDVKLMPDNKVRLTSRSAKLRIEPKSTSRYLTTLNEGYTAPILRVQNTWYQVSTPDYLSVKMKKADYVQLTTGKPVSSLDVQTPSQSSSNSSTFENVAIPQEKVITPPVQAVQETVQEKPIVSKPEVIKSNPVVSSNLPIRATTSGSTATYLLTPGDVISISVFGEPDMQLNNQRIGENGFVSFPLIGQVVVKGKSSQQVESMIEGMLSKGYLRDPKVNVVINAYRPLYVRGAVNSPGAYDFTEGLSVAKVLTLAGGVTKGALTDTLKLYRNDELFLQGLTTNSQTLIQPGDILTVEEGIGTIEKANLFIYLHGEVNSPGGYEYRDGLTVEKAIALAGGFSPRASRKKIDITRETLNSENPEKLKRVKLFLDLKPGDVIHVGASWF